MRIVQFLWVLVLVLELRPLMIAVGLLDTTVRISVVTTIINVAIGEYTCGNPCINARTC